MMKPGGGGGRDSSADIIIFSLVYKSNNLKRNKNNEQENVTRLFQLTLNLEELNCKKCFKVQYLDEIIDA